MRDELSFFYVLKGLLNGERGVYATTAGVGRQLDDGHYYLMPGEDDGVGPFSSADDAREAGARALAENDTLRILGHVFRRMDDTDYEAFGDAPSDAYIHYCDGGSLIWCPSTSELVEIDAEDHPLYVEKVWQVTDTRS